ncbi:hypothetical protein E2C01_049834 [Portunus trituberculatus]|uniref:Uncharacterized protein n=1 Tax=Portunus trituberculatus TaxID=210409 RepID=A0A5B7GEB1_PORTR|nr:hypothetical protein [Portunus trituberculatus]
MLGVVSFRMSCERHSSLREGAKLEVYPLPRLATMKSQGDADIRIRAELYMQIVSYTNTLGRKDSGRMFLYAMEFRLLFYLRGSHSVVDMDILTPAVVTVV